MATANRLSDIERVCEMSSIKPIEFLDRPSLYVHADHLRKVLDDIPGWLVAELVRCDRLQPKLSELLIAHYELTDVGVECDSVDLGLACLELGMMMDLVPVAGAVWHARRLRKIVNGKVLGEVLRGFHPHSYAIAMAHLDIAPEAGAAEEEPADPPLRTLIEADGLDCLVAWTDTLPAAIGARVKLKFPAEFSQSRSPSHLHRAIGPDVIRRVAASLIHVAD